MPTDGHVKSLTSFHRYLFISVTLIVSGSKKTHGNVHPLFSIMISTLKNVQNGILDTNGAVLFDINFPLDVQELSQNLTILIQPYCSLLLLCHIWPTFILSSIMCHLFFSKKWQMFDFWVYTRTWCQARLPCLVSHYLVALKLSTTNETLYTILLKVFTSGRQQMAMSHSKHRSIYFLKMDALTSHN